MQQAFDQQTQNWPHYNQSTGGKLRRAVILHPLTLLDFSPAMVEQARRRCAGLDVTLVCTDVDQILALLGRFVHFIATKERVKNGLFCRHRTHQ